MTEGDIVRAVSRAGAILDEARVYRYILWRNWFNEFADSPNQPFVNWIMLNPSTASEHDDDPTIRRCRGFTERMGYKAFVVTNLFALRSKDPRLLAQFADPVGPSNDVMILAAARGASRVLCAWGVNSQAFARGLEVRRLLAAEGITPFCLGIGAHQQPHHPLYLPYDREVIPYEPG